MNAEDISRLRSIPTWDHPLTRKPASSKWIQPVEPVCPSEKQVLCLLGQRHRQLVVRRPMLKFGFIIH